MGEREGILRLLVALGRRSQNLLLKETYMTFEELGLCPAVLSRLSDQKLTTPTPIQEKAIPNALNGRDVLGLAQTGTGKTLAFGLPIADLLMQSQVKCAPKKAYSLILAPTRELATQIYDNLFNLLKGAHLRVGLVVGGLSLNAQAQKMQRGVHLLVATPGRLIDLIERDALQLDMTQYFVLDEADQMLDLGFIHALRKIATMLPEERQTMLFSATMPKQMNELAQSFLNKPVRVEVSPPGKTADKIDQSVIYVAAAAKADLMVELLDKHRDELALVFMRTKHGAEKLAKRLAHAGYAVDAIHGNKSQGQRNRALDAFRAGHVRVLVATDVAARGLDIPQVRHVYNYELPNVADSYVHRIGRTARAGRSGAAVSLCSADEHEYLLQIEKLIGQKIQVTGGSVPMFDERAPAPKKKPGGFHQRRSKGGGGNGGNGGGNARKGGQRSRRAA